MKACSESYPNMHISLRLNKYDMRYLRFSAIFFLIYDVINHVQSKNISRWPILEYQSQAVVLLESEEKIEIRQFVSFLQVFPCLLSQELSLRNRQMKQ